MCSCSFANKTKVLGVQMSERANIFSVYLGMVLEIHAFPQKKWYMGTLHHME